MRNVRPALSAVLAVSCVMLSSIVFAQTIVESPPAAAPNANSSVLIKKTAPRVLPTQQQQRDSSDATAASALREERPVVPQLNIQLGRANGSSTVLPTANVQTLRRNGVDDNVAQCEAQADAQERLTCRDRLARSNPSRAAQVPLRSGN